MELQSTLARNNEIISLIEHKIERPVDWSTCMLHGTELPLELKRKLGGPTTGLKGFTSNIENQLAKCEEFAIVCFEVIEGEESKVDINDLSIDQKYLIQVYIEISSGSCTDDLSQCNPDTHSHLRWLSTVNRLLRSYMATTNPSENFKFSIPEASKDLHKTIGRTRLSRQTQYIGKLFLFCLFLFRIWKTSILRIWKIFFYA